MHGGVVPLSYVATHNITLDTKKTLLQCYPFAPCPIRPLVPFAPMAHAAPVDLVRSSLNWNTPGN